MDYNEKSHPVENNKYNSPNPISSSSLVAITKMFKKLYLLIQPLGQEGRFRI